MKPTLNGAKILLGITGGIAAYKAAELCRALRKMGAVVRVVMTPGATEFITPLTMQALSGNAVHTQLLDPESEAGMGHIELAKWPDLILIAPATADFIARYRQGHANDLLTTLLLASETRVALVPAMNQAMWRNALTQQNVRELERVLADQVMVWGPQDGEQACGDIGPGRMMEPAAICQEVLSVLDLSKKSLYGKRVVITAGPTREALDPVRYISNHSSGKMGYALAEACRNQGAEVMLISGPVQLACPKDVNRRDVASALEMHQAVMNELECLTDIFISTAAVADYRPVTPKSQKIKKQDDEIQILLCKNPDIVASVASRTDRPFTVGFAAETNDLLQYAEAKRLNKKLDMIVANDVSKPGLGFNSEQNEVYVLSQDEQIKIDKQPKSKVAEKIVSIIIDAMSKN